MYNLNIAQMNKLVMFCMLLLCVTHADIIDSETLQPFMFITQITGDLDTLEPSGYSISKLWPFPVEVYEVAMMKAKHQFLPEGFPTTEIYAYAGKVNGVFEPSFPGRGIFVFKNMPTYVIYTNNIEGKHILPVDLSKPFHMVSDFMDEVPVVPHAHGLETQMGPDGQPMGFWTKSGHKGKDYFSLKSNTKQKNQAIFRYHNTKDGLYWYHDHSMAITRLNVYAGLVGYYEIVDPQISTEEKNIMKYYGDVQRKFFAIVDKTFNEDGSLYYPSKPFSADFQTWVPDFYGNTMIVNGKVWPLIVLEPKVYRFVFLNGCQSRFLNIYFDHKDRKLEFQMFRRDSDFLNEPVTMTEHFLLIGGRVEIFIDLTDITGDIILRNDAVPPHPMVDIPINELTSQIMKIAVKPPKRNLQQTHNMNTNVKKHPDIVQVVSNTVSNSKIVKKVKTALKGPTSSAASETVNLKASVGQTFSQLIQNRLNLYSKNSNQMKEYDFIDEPQAPNYYPSSVSKSKNISVADFVNSNDGTNPTFYQLVEATNRAKKDDSVNTKDFVMGNVEKTKQSITDFVVQNTNAVVPGYFSKDKKSLSIKNVPYPRFEEGKAYHTILADTFNSMGELYSIMIDGVNVDQGCAGAKYKLGKTYDFYIINLTMDDHPIHIHLINFQVIGRFNFDVKKYRKDWEAQNGQLAPGGIGKIPKQIDARPYKIGETIPPTEEEKLFLDVIKVTPEQVTIARVKFSNHLGKDFPFDASGGRYVWHCHILEHEDNEMMRYFCVD